MSRRVVWLQLLIGWLPLWVLFTVLVSAAHGISFAGAGFIALQSIACAALLGIVVHRVVSRMPWQMPVRVGFLATHLVLASLYAVCWMILNSIVDSVLHHRLAISVGPSFHLAFVTGVWLYVMIAGVAYTNIATERAAIAESSVVKAQLASLRAQLNPHFLFNALHSVVQLIPQEPRRAAKATEELAALLRTTIEEDRELVSVSEELAFVERYLALERMRFGDRLLARVEVPGDARASELPVFALQTLVENAVRHAASPRVEATTITITGALDGATLTMVVMDDGAGASENQMSTSIGSGLRRLRERLQAIYGSAGRLDTEGSAGFAATLTIPQG